MHPAAAELDEEENVQPPQGNGLDREEVDGEHARTELPIAWRVATARAHESSLADDLLQRVRERKFKPETATLDKGYDVSQVYDACERAGAVPIIPLRKTPAVKRGAHRAPECEHGTWTFAGADAEAQRNKVALPDRRVQTSVALDQG